MSFPNPEYIKNFLTTKLTRRNSDNTTLLADDSMQSSSSLEGVTVFKDGEDNLEGFEISKKSSEHCHNHNGSVVQNRSKSNPEKFTSKTPLQLNKLELGCYGAAEQVELNKKENTMKYRKSKASQITGETSYQGGAGRYERLDNESTSSNVSCNSTGREAESCGSDDGHSHSHGYSSDDSDLDSEHCHDESDEKEQTENRKRKKALRKLIIATVLSFLFMCGEILGGYLANSLAIMTDASHLLTDVSSFLVSIIALQMAARPSSKSMTFGWHRAEVIGAITSVIAIWVVTGVLVYLAVNRLIKNEYELDGKTMLITAACAVGFNIVMGLVLHESHGHAHGHSHGHSHDHSHGHSHDHGHSHEHKHNHSDDKVKKRSTHHDEETGNVNVRAAFIHVLGDLLQSLGVLVAAFIIYFKPEYKIADPICTFLFSILVLATTITILRDTIVILMEGTPAGINYEKVKEKLLSIQGVIAVHDLRIWSLTLNQCVMSCHLAVDKTVRPGTILKKATKTLKAAYNFHSMTIQVETYSMIMDDCKKCSPPKTPV